jgi:uncharacterized membrane protein YccC
MLPGEASVQHARAILEERDREADRAIQESLIADGLSAQEAERAVRFARYELASDTQDASYQDGDFVVPHTPGRADRVIPHLMWLAMMTFNGLSIAGLIVLGLGFTRRGWWPLALLPWASVLFPATIMASFVMVGVAWLRERVGGGRRDDPPGNSDR